MIELELNHGQLKFKLNSNLKTTIITKDGPTRQIEIKDSIRQGGVLSATLYALMMDEINKDLIENTDYPAEHNSGGP